ncbi:MAG: cytochrome C oxidase subunit IV family protein [Hyphomicrobiaceae bacterium]
MADGRLVFSWCLLVGLSAATAGLSAVRPGDLSPIAFTVAVLILAGFKARIILFRYMGLAASRFWSRAFDAALIVFLLLALVVYLIGTET